MSLRPNPFGHWGDALTDLCMTVEMKGSPVIPDIHYDEIERPEECKVELATLSELEEFCCGHLLPAMAAGVIKPDDKSGFGTWAIVLAEPDGCHRLAKLLHEGMMTKQALSSFCNQFTNHNSKNNGF